MIIGKTHIDVSKQKIVELDVFGIVNPANNMLWMGGGISSEIRKEAGKTVEEEALAKAPAEIGAVVVTGAGNLKARWIIHAVISDQDLTVSEETVQKAIDESLVKADKIGCRTLAIPLLSLGTHDLEKHIIAQIMVNRTISFLLNTPHSFERIVFVYRDDSVGEIFNNTLLEKFTKHG